jgi:hypothetical protein
VFIVQAASGPLLVFAIEAEDHELARQVYESSTLAIAKERSIGFEGKVTADPSQH